eukprot:CAMPEP_0198250078 /NCGR_PEP_ID=MMETSP1447-20131203/1393_1 /TAXON_ID=420782 /ORGANISM="Chaetoceros dichaeta, Strain CCMP1751" /LENGTH=255 /DNA_ID=CAMNT_0043934853 /DNA_START=53 /DNA_END=820 /DNA_ORIENTATION=+
MTPLSLLFLLLLTSSTAFSPYTYTFTPGKATSILRSQDGSSQAMSNEEESKTEMSLMAEETALVLIEYQNEFTTAGGALHEAVKECMEKTGTLENSKKVMDAARSAGCKIIHLPIAFEEGHLEISNNSYGILAGVKEGGIFKVGTSGAEICEMMKPAEGDIVAKGKNGLCGFASTNLDFLLRQNKITNVVLGGFLTNCCVESTMRTAYEKGYNVYTMKDCCAATSVEGQEAAYEHTFGMFSIPTTSDEIISAVTK